MDGDRMVTCVCLEWIVIREYGSTPYVGMAQPSH
jgi:hypothetical protein